MPTKPNFLIIMTDQQRGDALSIEDHPVLLTPNMDTIAAQGVRFAHAYSTCPACIPARRSLMSGQFPATHGMVGMVDGCEWNPAATLPGELRKAGYHTQIVGRSMHQFPRRKRFGFDHMVLSGDVHPDDVVEHLPAHGVEPSWSHGLPANGWTSRPWHLDDNLHPSNRTVDDAIRFLNRRDPSCPFLLVANFAAPHPPLYPPAFYLDRYLRLDLPEPEIGGWAIRPENDGKGLSINSPTCCLEGEALRSCRAGYYGLINHLDDQIYRLITPPFGGMDRETAQNTVIIFIADHGEMLGDHHMFRKSRAYEASARIPFLIQAPAWMGLTSGQVRHEAVCLEDVMPTVLELAGIDVPESVDGSSLLTLLGNEEADRFRPFIHGENAANDPDLGHHYLTDGHSKYIWFSQTGREQLFDLDNDPNECVDLTLKPEQAHNLEEWRERLVAELAGRQEGFTDGTQLFVGRPCPRTLDHVGGIA